MEFAATLLLPVLVVLLLCLHLGFAWALLLLPPALRPFRWLLMPLVGLAIWLVVTAALTIWTALTATQIAAGLALLALPLNGWVVWRGRGDGRQETGDKRQETGGKQLIPQPATRNPLPATRYPLPATLPLLLIAALAFTLTILPTIGWGVSLPVGSNWDPADFYVPLGRVLHERSQRDAGDWPRNPLTNVFATPPVSGRVHGFSFLHAVASYASGVDPLFSFTPLLGLMLAFIPPSTFVLGRVGGLAVGPALLATGLAALGWLPLWTAYNSFAEQVHGMTLLPLALLGSLVALRDGGWRALLTGGLCTAALAIGYYPTLAMYVAAIGMLGLGLMWQLTRSGVNNGEQIEPQRPQSARRSISSSVSSVANKPTLITLCGRGLALGGLALLLSAPAQALFFFSDGFLDEIQRGNTGFQIGSLVGLADTLGLSATWRGEPLATPALLRWPALAAALTLALAGLLNRRTALLTALAAGALLYLGYTAATNFYYGYYKGVTFAVPLFTLVLAAGVALVGGKLGDRRPLTTDSRQQTADSRQQPADSRQQPADSRQQTADSSQQTADSRQQTAASRQQTTDSRQQTADSRQQTADNRQQTTDNRQQTADSRQQTADSRQGDKETSVPTGDSDSWSRGLGSLVSCLGSRGLAVSRSRGLAVFLRAALLAAMLLLVGLNAWTIWRVQAQYATSGPRLWDARQAEVLGLRAALPPSASVLIVPSGEHPRTFYSLISYTLLGHELFGNFPTAYNGLEAGTGRRLPDFALLPEASDPAAHGYQASELRWSGAGMRLYQRSIGVRSHRTLGGNGRYPQVAPGEVLQLRLGAKRVALPGEGQPEASTPDTARLALAIASFGPGSVELAAGTSVARYDLRAGLAELSTEILTTPGTAEVRNTGTQPLYLWWAELRDPQASGPARQPDEVFLQVLPGPISNTPRVAAELQLHTLALPAAPQKLTALLTVSFTRGERNWREIGQWVFFPTGGNLQLNANLAQLQVAVQRDDTPLELYGSAASAGDGNYQMSLLLANDAKIVYGTKVWQWQVRNGQVADITPDAVAFDIVPLPRPATPFEHDSADGRMRLRGFSLPQRNVRAGEPLGIQLVWQSLQRPAGDLRARLVLRDNAGQPLAEQTQALGASEHGTSRWQEGEVSEHGFSLAVPRGAPPGNATLLVELLDANNQPLPFANGNTLQLTEVVIR